MRPLGILLSISRWRAAQVARCSELRRSRTNELSASSDGGGGGSASPASTCVPKVTDATPAPASCGETHPGS
jgi:hypothetical protein